MKHDLLVFTVLIIFLISMAQPAFSEFPQIPSNPMNKTGITNIDIEKPTLIPEEIKDGIRNKTGNEQKDNILPILPSNIPDKKDNNGTILPDIPGITDSARNITDIINNTRNNGEIKDSYQNKTMNITDGIKVPGIIEKKPLRNITKDQLRNSIDSYKEARKGYQNNTGDKNNTKGEQLKNARNIAISSINTIINNLFIMENKIERSTLSDNIKSDMISQIESNITWFETRKTEVQNANNTTEIRTITLSVDEKWGNLKVDMRKEAGLLSCDDMELLINDAKNASSIINKKIGELKTHGKDTGKLEQELASYDAHVKNTEQYMKNARDEFEKISTPANSDIHFNAGIKDLKSADNEMKQAYIHLKEIYRLMNNR